MQPTCDTQSKPQTHERYSFMPKLARQNGDYRAQRRQCVDGGNAATMLFCIAYGAWLSYTLLSLTLLMAFVPPLVTTCLWPLVLVVLATSELMRRATLNEFPTFLVLVAVSLLVQNVMGDVRPLQAIVFVYCARSIPFKVLAMESVIITLLVALAAITSSQVGLVVDYIWSKGVRLRHGLGFKYTTTPSHLLLNIAICCVLVFRKRLSILAIAVLFAANVILFTLTDSRNSFICSAVLLVAVFLCRFIASDTKKNGGVLPWVVAVVPFIVFPMASFALSVVYDPSIGWMSELNEITNTRLDNQHSTLLKYGVGWFGQKMNLVGNGLNNDGVMFKAIASPGSYDNHYVDNSFMYALCHYGIVIFFVAIIFYVLLGYRAVQNNDWALGLCLFIWAVHSLFDPQMIWLEYATIMFLGYRRQSEPGSGSVLGNRGIAAGDEESANKLMPS